MRGVEAHGGVQGRRRTLQLRRQIGVAREAGRSGLRDPATGHEDTGQADGGVRESGPLGPVLRRSGPARPGHRARVPRLDPGLRFRGDGGGVHLLLKQRATPWPRPAYGERRGASLSPRAPPVYAFGLPHGGGIPVVFVSPPPFRNEQAEDLARSRDRAPSTVSSRAASSPRDDLLASVQLGVVGFACPTTDYEVRTFKVPGGVATASDNVGFTIIIP